MRILMKIKFSMLVMFLTGHLWYFYRSKNKSLVLADVRIWSVKLNVLKKNEICTLLYLLALSRTFRNLFYLRIQNIPKIFKKLFPEYKGLIIHKDTLVTGGGLFFYHPYSTVVNAKSIGENCSIRHLTTIGNKGYDEEAKPTILNNVDIGANAIIIGNIVIGNNVIIGAGAVVTKNVPDNCVVVGNPAFIVKQNGVRTTPKL